MEVVKEVLRVFAYRESYLDIAIDLSLWSQCSKESSIPWQFSASFILFAHFPIVLIRGPGFCPAFPIAPIRSLTPVTLHGYLREVFPTAKTTIVHNHQSSGAIRGYVGSTEYSHPSYLSEQTSPSTSPSRPAYYFLRLLKDIFTMGAEIDCDTLRYGEP